MGKHKKKQPGHYCRICGERKPNEKFSGRGHATHICKSCTKKSPAQKSEDMTINRLNGMVFRYLNESEIKWLKNRCNDSRPEVKALAQSVFEEKFPRQARNKIKANLHIKNMIFHVCCEVYDCYGDAYATNTVFVADTSGKIIRQTFNESDVLTDEAVTTINTGAMRKYFNVVVHNYEAPFWEADLCREISDDSDIDLLPDFLEDSFDEEYFAEDMFVDDADGMSDDERVATWSIKLHYKNGTQQAISGYDYLPDPVVELFDHFQSFFEADEEIFDDEIDE